MKKIKSITAITICIIMMLSTFTAKAMTVSTSQNTPLLNKYVSAENTTKLLLSANMSQKINAENNSILLISSMEIKTPKIDVSKIIPLHNPMISSLEEKDVFFQELKEHGIENKDMTLYEYRELESSWKMDKEHIEITKLLFPELQNKNIDDWTIGDSQQYSNEQTNINLKNRFTPQQLLQLNRRGIEIEDTFYLFKEFHTADNILKQTDNTLKTIIEEYYKMNLSMMLGNDAAIQIIEKYNYNSSESVVYSSTPTYTLPPDAEGKYVWVKQPLYGGDYFANSVQTTEEWRKIQSYRALLTQATLYAQIYYPTNELHCSNMHGTYSRSQNGAHEGIDFAIEQGRYIYSPVYGTRLTQNAAYHQISIYDSTISDAYTTNAGAIGKTYSFLHMTNLTSASSFNVLDYMGREGLEGNTNGESHVHFEVNLGQTTTLNSSRNNHNVDSSSPYQLMRYIGEAQQA